MNITDERSTNPTEEQIASYISDVARKNQGLLERFKSAPVQSLSLVALFSILGICIALLSAQVGQGKRQDDFQNWTRAEFVKLGMQMRTDLGKSSTEIQKLTEQAEAQAKRIDAQDITIASLADQLNRLQQVNTPHATTLGAPLWRKDVSLDPKLWKLQRKYHKLEKRVGRLETAQATSYIPRVNGRYPTPF